MFELNKNEKQKLAKWIEKHKKKCNTFNRYLTYSFTPTGIGTIVEVKCSCGKKVDVTDESNW